MGGSQTLPYGEYHALSSNLPRHMPSPYENNFSEINMGLIMVGLIGWWDFKGNP